MIQYEEETLILVDGSSYLYRAYYIFPILTNRSGEPTGAIYGVINMLKKLIVRYKNSHIIMVFDAKGKTFRDELFKKYKSHRIPMPYNLCMQVKPLYEIIKAMGISLIELPGVEADDVIGTLAFEAKKQGHKVLISTIDKDIAQLVSSEITIINTMNNTLLGPKEVEIKYGVPPSLIIDLLAIMGDTADNIPGVPGIGKKTAQNLIKSIGGIDSIYDNLHKIMHLSFRGAKNTVAKLEQYQNNVFLSYQLAKIKTDIDLTLINAHLIKQEVDINTLKTLFGHYQFKHWLTNLHEGKFFNREKTSSKIFQNSLSKNILEKIEMNNTHSSEEYVLILKEDTFINWLNKLQNAGIFAFKLKTDSFLDILNANIIGIAFSLVPGEAAYLPIRYLDVHNQLDLTEVLKRIKPLLEDKNIVKIGQNLKYDLNVLRNYNIELNGINFDTILESYCLNSTVGGYDIESLALRWLNHNSMIFEENYLKWKKRFSFNDLIFGKDIYSILRNVDIILQLHLQMWLKLNQESNLKKIFENIEMPLMYVLSRIERNGVLIDENLLEKYSEEISIRLVELEQRAYKLAGQSFNLSSTKQLQAILFENEGIKPIKKTPSGVPSTSEEVLMELKYLHPLPKIILEYRSLSKLKSNYTNKLPFMINQITGRIHTSYHQVMTATGRLSSTAPNLQNIPVRNKEGRRIRQAFIATPGKCIVSADYSQIELRILAHLSQDSGLLNAFILNEDIHRVTASEIFGIEMKQVSIEQRRSAKAINFGLLYGMSSFGLSRYLNISSIEAKNYIERYFKRYPGVQFYIEKIRRQAIKKGYVETLSGRRLWLPNIKSNNIRYRKAAERAAINAPMQGTAADIIKLAMIDIDNWIMEQNNNSIKMVMQVHDELVFEVRKDIVENISKKIQFLMENAIKLDIPLQVSIGIGNNWEQAH